MRKIACLSDQERKALFRNTADKMGLTDAIVEKDFWVCYTLDYLFQRSAWQGSIAFKGGTSLSKAFNLINRFSEDIDLILDWRILGYEKQEPWEDRTNNQQRIFNEESKARNEIFLEKEFCPTIKKEISKELNIDAKIYIDNNDKQSVLFSYPRLFSNPSILQVIRLEIGALAAWTMIQPSSIRSYVSQYYPNLFEEEVTTVLTVSPERTFWEKVTILHHEANRPESSKMPQRYSRHYYDLYCMSMTQVKDSAYEHIDILEKVVNFKMKFYPRTWAKYQDAVSGTLKLIPPEYRLSALKADYEAMQEMLYGEVPSFDEILLVLKQIEEEINNL